MERKQNKQFVHGYAMGYRWAADESGRADMIFRELRSRGIGIKTVYAVGFRRGVLDAEKGKPQLYED